MMILIAGPCVIENENVLEEAADYLTNAIEGKDIDFYFKASAVKDNRTKKENYSGVGMEKGVSMLLDIKRRWGVKITTDFHTDIDIMRYGGFVDLIQIPAYLAQQTSMIKAAAGMNKPIHIKKPQFLGPVEASQPVKKYRDFGSKNDVILTDRGTMFGYNQTIFDPRHIPIMLDSGANYVLADVTHPNKNYPGDVFENIVVLAKSAIVAGASGIFIETHPNCNEALCDGKTMLPLEHIEGFLEEVYSLWRRENEITT
jgi:2-dehydro-3-deoxyphosphooctonate aldolase (KDO 8-P synthase)